MLDICRNCEQTCSGNFCSSCGQSLSVNRINMHFVLHDLQHGLLHFDNGLFYTIKELLINPGSTIKDFIGGKWMKYFHPLSLLLILTAIYEIFSPKQKFDATNDAFLNAFYNIFNYLLEHRNLLILLILPITTLITKIFFRKQEYNYFEILVLESYSQSITTLVSIILLPITIYFSENENITYLNFILILFFTIRTKVLFFNNIFKPKVVFYSMITSFLNFIVLIFLFLVIAFVIYNFNLN